jgi:hypothetical protein
MEAEFEKLRKGVGTLTREWDFLLNELERRRKDGVELEKDIFQEDLVFFPLSRARRLIEEQLVIGNPAYHFLQTVIENGNYEFLGVVSYDEKNPYSLWDHFGYAPAARRVATIIELAAAWAHALDLVFYSYFHIWLEEGRSVRAGLVEYFDSLPFDYFKEFPVAIQREWSRVELEYERLIKSGVSLPAATVSNRQTETALEVNELVEPMDCVDRGYSFDPDSRVLVWHGQAYPLTRNMADVVGVLFKARERGRPEVSLDHLKGSVDSSALDHSLSKVFERRKGRDKFTDPVWGVIESVGKGVYRLADPRNP